jgi:hypothetical protein
MKTLTISKLSVVLLCLGGALVAAPQSRAQSEIAPDHFDGTDSWVAAASVKAMASKAKSNAASATVQARNTTPSSPALQPVAARTVLARRSGATANKKRKTTTPTSN